jgi:hypothetical protein
MSVEMVISILLCDEFSSTLSTLVGLPYLMSPFVDAQTLSTRKQPTTEGAETPCLLLAVVSLVCIQSSRLRVLNSIIIIFLT